MNGERFPVRSDRMAKVRRVRAIFELRFEFRAERLYLVGHRLEWRDETVDRVR